MAITPNAGTAGRHGDAGQVGRRPGEVGRRPHHRRRVRWAGLAGALGLLGVGLAACSATPSARSTASGALVAAGSQGGRGSCAERARSTTVTAVSQDSALDDAWTSYGNSGQGWVAGDSVHAYRIGRGTTLWTFADTFLGPINPDGSQSPSKPLYHSVFVVQKDNRFTTVVGGTKAHPASLVTTKNPDDIYLGLAGLVSGGRLQEIFLNDLAGPHITLTQEPTGTLLGVFAVPSLTKLKVVALPEANPTIQWGAAITRWGADTYIYGATSAGGDKSLYVARVEGTNLLGHWQFWTGNSWSSRQAAAAPIASGVSDELSVTPYDGMAVLVTTPTNVSYSAAIDFDFACSPVGPFRPTKSILASYYTGSVGAAKYRFTDVYVYDAMDQAALNHGSTWLVSFDRNVLEYGQLARNVTVYRPSYLLVKIGPRPTPGAPPASSG